MHEQSHQAKKESAYYKSTQVHKNFNNGEVIMETWLPLTNTEMQKPQFRFPHQEEMIMSHQNKKGAGPTKEKK